MVDLGKKNALIPGQQLYGCMIPRPKYDEEIHRYERIVAEQKMRMFKDCVGRLNSLDGLSEFERRQLIRSDTLVGPMSIGYEVVPLEVSESMSTDSSEDARCGSIRPKIIHSVSVKLMSDRLEYVDSRESRNLILESDGKSMYCVSETSPGEDEGVEIISTDQVYTSSCDDFSEDEESLTFVDSASTTDDRLSCVLGCNEDVCSTRLEEPVLKLSPRLEETLLKYKIE